MGLLRVLCSKGDTKVTWDSTKAIEVEEAKKAFERYLDKGFNAFRIAKRGQRGEMTTKFDAQAEEILFVPPIAGGC